MAILLLLRTALLLLRTGRSAVVVAPVLRCSR